jgi:hypothetical protein
MALSREDQRVEMLLGKNRFLTRHFSAPRNSSLRQATAVSRDVSPNRRIRNLGTAAEIRLTALSICPQHQKSIEFNIAHSPQCLFLRARKRRKAGYPEMELQSVCRRSSFVLLYRSRGSIVLIFEQPIRASQTSTPIPDSACPRKNTQKRS